jgi:hypothetical protein
MHRKKSIDPGAHGRLALPQSRRDFALAQCHRLERRASCPRRCRSPRRSSPPPPCSSPRAPLRRSSRSRTGDRRCSSRLRRRPIRGSKRSSCAAARNGAETTRRPIPSPRSARPT